MVGLRSRVPAKQHEAAQSLRDFVETEAQELTPQEMYIFLSEMFRGIEQLLNSAEAHEAGAVLAIDMLMDVEAEDVSTRLLRFANYLRTALAHEANTPSTLHLARDALGHLARADSLTSEVVDEEAKRSLDVLRDEPGVKARGGTNRERAAQELRTLCAALVLQALAENAPTVGLAFEHLCAPRARVRSAAAAALQACLRLVATRVSNQQLKWYSELLAASRVALARDSNVHSWHGAAGWTRSVEALLACCRGAREPPRRPRLELQCLSTSRRLRRQAHVALGRGAGHLLRFAGSARRCCRCRRRCWTPLLLPLSLHAEEAAEATEASVARAGAGRRPRRLWWSTVGATRWWWTRRAARRVPLTRRESPRQRSSTARVRR